ncbi:MAG: HAD family hydrolase, partial [Acetivibrio ethanolgignens]
MGKIKLIGLDLDGTLLNDKKELSGRNRKAIERAAAQGVFIVPATGRPLVGLQTPVLSLPVKYALTANGAAV